MQATTQRSSFFGAGMARTSFIAAPAKTQQRFAGVPDVVCMAKKKPSKAGRKIVTLECTEARAEGGTPSRYTTQKSQRNTPERLELKKWNKYLKRYTLHREIK